MNKIIETYKKKYGNMPIRNKLIVMTVSLILIPTVILTLIFYSVASRYIKRNTQASIMDTMWQAAENIDGKIRGIEDILFDISTDTEFQRYIKILDNPELSEYDFLVKSDKLKSIVTHKISKCNDIKAVYLTTNSGKEIQVKNVLEHYPNDIPMQDVINQKGGNVWETVLKEYDVIPVYKELVDLKTMSDMGCITLYFEKNYLFQVFQNIQVAESQDIYLLNANGESVDQIFPEELKKHVVFNEINKEMGEVSVQYKKNKRELVFCKLQTLPWTLVGIIDNEWQYRQFWNISVATLVLFLTISALLVLICIKVSKSISRPLDDLTEYMTAFSKGDFHIEAPVKYTDEIGILRKEFNAMVENTNHLIEKLFMEEKLKQEAQIKALQMQINPHFFIIHWIR